MAILFLPDESIVFDSIFVKLHFSGETVILSSPIFEFVVYRSWSTYSSILRSEPTYKKEFLQNIVLTLKQGGFKSTNWVYGQSSCQSECVVCSEWQWSLCCHLYLAFAVWLYNCCAANIWFVCVCGPGNVGPQKKLCTILLAPPLRNFCSFCSSSFSFPSFTSFLAFPYQVASDFSKS